MDSMQPSYAQDLGVGSIQHGFYGSMMNVLGGCVGTVGMIPCCPFPNPFKNIREYSVIPYRDLLPRSCSSCTLTL